MKNIKISYYDRIDISEEIDVFEDKRINKSVIFVTIGII